MKNTENKTNGLGMSAYTLKIIAIIAMLIDHIAWAFVPTGTILGQVMHTIGRITAPIMSYFISEGFYHTHNVKKICLKTRHICHNFTYPILLFYERPIAYFFC